MSEPIATTGAERKQYGLCRCGTCGEVGRCTPTNDYYGSGTRKLKCERCLFASVGAKHEGVPDPACTTCGGVGVIGGVLPLTGNVLVCSCMQVRAVVHPPMPKRKRAKREKTKATKGRTTR